MQAKFLKADYVFWDKLLICNMLLKFNLYAISTPKFDLALLQSRFYSYRKSACIVVDKAV